MENGAEYACKPTEGKTVAYDYLFIYRGMDTFKGEAIAGAAIELAIRAYKEEEVKLMEEPKIGSLYLRDAYQVSFDREKLFCIKKNPCIDSLFCFIYGWDKTESEVFDYSLYCLDASAEKLLKDFPGEFEDISLAVPVEASEDEFKSFLSGNIDGFDIAENKNAQACAIAYI